MKQSRFAGHLVVAALTVPVLGAGTCLTIAQESLINGYFGALTPLLAERLEDRLDDVWGTGQESSDGKSSARPQAEPRR